MDAQDYEQIHMYLTTKIDGQGCTKLSYSLNKVLIALSKSSGHFPPSFFQYSNFNKAVFFNGNQMNMFRQIDDSFTTASSIVKAYLETGQNQQDAISAINWIFSVFGPALDELFNPKSRYLAGYHINPTGIPGYTIFQAERDQLLPILLDLKTQIEQH